MFELRWKTIEQRKIYKEKNLTSLFTYSFPTTLTKFFSKKKPFVSYTTDEIELILLKFA